MYDDHLMALSPPKAVHHLPLSNLYSDFQLSSLSNHLKLSSDFDCGRFTVGTFLDLSKAFDTINRDILLRELEYFDITGR